METGGFTVTCWAERVKKVSTTSDFQLAQLTWLWWDSFWGFATKTLSLRKEERREFPGQFQSSLKCSCSAREGGGWGGGSPPRAVTLFSSLSARHPKDRDAGPGHWGLLSRVMRWDSYLFFSTYCMNFVRGRNAINLDLDWLRRNKISKKLLFAKWELLNKVSWLELREYFLME